MSSPPDLWETLLGPSTLRQTIWQWEDGHYRQTTYGAVFERARRVAAALHARGVRRGDVVGQIITNGAPSLAGFFGAWFAGAAVASLPIIARGVTVAGYHAQLREICEQVKPACVLMEDQYLGFIAAEGSLGPELISCESLAAYDRLGNVDPPNADETMFVQYSSGTTGAPRGVRLTTQTIATHMALLVTRLAVDPERDIGAIWLPLSHDMGFFGGNLLGWYTGIAGVRSPPERFLSSPWTWMDDCSRYGVTLTAAPPSALGIAARAERARPSDQRLAIRQCLVGAEEIYLTPLTLAAEAFAHRGLTLDAITPAYGLAEATLAVTVGEPDHAPKSLGSFATGSLSPDLVSSGTPLPGVDVSVDPDNDEIVISGPTLAAGYFVGDQAGFVDGAFRSGDIGHIEGNELFVVGRLDDCLIVGGRNVRARPIEQVLDTHPRIRDGDCALVALPDPTHGRPTIVLVTETTDGVVIDPAAVGELRGIAMELDGLPIDHIVALPPGRFPKTPSGKAQRYRCRELAAAALSERPETARLSR